MPSGSGSPEATPSLNGLWDSRAAAATLPANGTVNPAAASTNALWIRSRRDRPEIACRRSFDITRNSSIELGWQVQRLSVHEHAGDLVVEHTSKRQLGQFVGSEEGNALGLDTRRRHAPDSLTDEKHLVDMERIGWDVRMS